MFKNVPGKLEKVRIWR